MKSDQVLPKSKASKKTTHDNNPPSQETIQRNVLPIPDVTPVGLTTFDARDPETRYPPIRRLRPPAGSPNVLVILIDDAGFGSSSAFGGPCQTPNFEKLAAGGAQLVIIDLGADGFDALQAIDICRQHSPSPRVVAFASHVQGELIAAARKAGADEVLARSAFVGKLPALLGQLREDADAAR